MTKQELVEAYTRGDIDRRAFIQRLTALGVGSAAALAYATQLAPSAAASTGGGFVRQEGADEETDYGTAVELASDEEAIAAASEGESTALDVVNDILDTYSPDDFEEFNLNGIDAYEQLQILQQQLDDHLSALEAAGGSGATAGIAGRARLARRVPVRQGADLRSDLTDLRDVLEILADLYAGLTPAVEGDELRQTLANISVVKGRQVAFVNLLLGEQPFEETFAEPIGPTQAASEFEALFTE